MANRVQRARDNDCSHTCVHRMYNPCSILRKITGVNVFECEPRDDQQQLGHPEPTAVVMFDTMRVDNAMPFKGKGEVQVFDN